MRTLKGIGLVLGALIVGILGWGLFEPYFIDVESYRVPVPNLPSAWEEQRIAQISDWQLGMWLDNDYTIERAVDWLVEERPAAVLISGDFVYHAVSDPEGTLQRAVELVRPLGEAEIPTFAVLGNHDYAMKSKSGDPDEALARRVA